MTKEEIFKQSCDWYLIHPDDITQGLRFTKEIINRSMDEYAKQKAIETWDSCAEYMNYLFDLHTKLGRFVGPKPLDREQYLKGVNND